MRDGSPEGPAGVPVCHFVEFLQILPIPLGLHKSDNPPNPGIFVKYKQNIPPGGYGKAKGLSPRGACAGGHGMIP